LHEISTLEIKGNKAHVHSYLCKVFSPKDVFNDEFDSIKIKTRGKKKLKTPLKL
jgi:hypothetical protein